MRSRAGSGCHSPQRSQFHSLSAPVEYALLLPYCVRIHSSPAKSIGVPCAIIIAVNIPRISWRFVFSAVASPIIPQSRERLLSSPLCASHHADVGAVQHTGLSGPQALFFVL